MTTTPTPTHIYIDNVRRQVVGGWGSPIYVDSDELPGRHCACHNVGSSAIHYLEQGVKVRTLGHWYSLRPDLVAAPKPAPKPKLRSWWSKLFYWSF